ncbi:hypothetical protein D3C73_1187150 [compost metagenome]
MFFMGLTLLPSLFLEIVIHLFNPCAHDIRTCCIQLLGASIKLAQNCLIDTYLNRFAFRIVRWRTPHLFGRHRFTPLSVPTTIILLWAQKVNPYFEPFILFPAGLFFPTRLLSRVVQAQDLDIQIRLLGVCPKTRISISLTKDLF